MTDRETRQERKRRRDELIAQRQRQEQSGGEQARQGDTVGRAGEQKQGSQPSKPRLPE